MDRWVRMPSDWVRENDILKSMKWIGHSKSDNVAALMIYFVMLHRVSVDLATGEVGHCHLTYEQINSATGLSKTKISGGLKLLKEHSLIAQIGNSRNGLFDVKGIPEAYENTITWAIFPVKGLYSSSLLINAFKHFSLRSKYELYALKLYFVIIAFRDRKTNSATIGYEKINEYSSIPQNDIAGASSLLTAIQLIRISSQPSEINDYSTKNVYTPKFLERKL